MAPPPPPPVVAGTPDDARARTLELHLYYLTELWSMNSWSLYNRYKKHLPKERRPEVDAWINLHMTGASRDALRAALSKLLEGTWEREDWARVIRDPKLLEGEVLTTAQRREWAAMLAAG
jgi:hypothetical protein